jgi:hypothetical protein
MLALLAAVAAAAKRLETEPSILLVVAGIGIAFVPGLPKVELAPEIVLLVILPPLIYSAGCREGWRNSSSICGDHFVSPLARAVHDLCNRRGCAVVAFDWGVGFCSARLLHRLTSWRRRLARKLRRAFSSVMRARVSPMMPPLWCSTLLPLSQSAQGLFFQQQASGLRSHLIGETIVGYKNG